jgi:hypothetical protein
MGFRPADHQKTDGGPSEGLFYIVRAVDEQYHASNSLLRDVSVRIGAT